jgi:hypothetical protein
LKPGRRGPRCGRDPLALREPMPLTLGRTSSNAECRRKVVIQHGSSSAKSRCETAAPLSKTFQHFNFETSQLLCSQSFAGSFSPPKKSSPLQSSKSGLFQQNTRVGSPKAFGLLRISGSFTTNDRFLSTVSFHGLMNPFPILHPPIDFYFPHFHALTNPFSSKPRGCWKLPLFTFKLSSLPTCEHPTRLWQIPPRRNHA